ncbi:MAG TPA: hypothetical protein VHY84_12580 [Bryobacteraceae bacterium]|nr:hypothetical protein [Bryobacteraceae bacterium]
MLINGLAIVTLLLFQYPYPGRVQRQQQTPNVQGANTDAVATFTGTFKSADKKSLFIDLEDGNTMRMYITGSTKFFRDDKAAKASDFHAGDNVTVDASRDARLNMLAVRVANVPTPNVDKQPADKQPDKSTDKPADKQGASR